ncbi:hypothetical protein KI387_033452 [Taxus chinensis]|uniref:Carboxypeptidase n=1 Tax=Taxus chinensis TaxID=29808 RepID=A0AA38BRX9_TAXCH|nr:hypothetical protein KI387_033452 [Taxus chinensis]
MVNRLCLWVVLCFYMIIAAQSIQTGNTSRNNEQDGVSENLVTGLPGQPIVGFNHYSGYVTVNEEHGRALFYWFFEAATVKERRPLVLWLNGGPGCSSVGYGATQEIGPFLLNGGETGLSLNLHSWNRAEDSYTFLQNWLTIFPQYRSHEFYITGESYAGLYVPELAELITDRNKVSSKSLYINLKGFMVGNPLTDTAHDWDGIVDYAWSHAIVSDETYGIIKTNCDFKSSNTWSNKNCSGAVDEMYAQYNEIDMYSLYTSKCIPKNYTTNATSGANQLKYFTNKIMKRMMGGGSYDPCLNGWAVSYYNRYDVQKALHVIRGSTPRNWSLCNEDILDDWNDKPPSVLPVYLKLIEAGVRIWVYSGDTDGRVPVLSTRYNMNALGLPTKGPWRPWYHRGQVGGWMQEYEGLTFATFLGAGHEVPLFKPREALAVFQSFISGTPLPNKRQQLS